MSNGLAVLAERLADRASGHIVPRFRKWGRRFLGTAQHAGVLLSLATVVPSSQAAPWLADCGGRLMRQANGAWLYWGRAGSGNVAGIAGLDGGAPAYQAGLSEEAFARPRRLKGLDSRFAQAGNPERKATRIYCNKDGTVAHATLTDGTLVGWGSDSTGQIGQGTIGSSSVPLTVLGITNAAQVAGGLTHTVALLSSGSVAAWGGNLLGQVGDGTSGPGSESRPTPVAIPSLTNAIAVAAGNNHSLALLTDGTVRAWGSNNYGQLGDGSTANRPSPVVVSGLTGVTAIAAGAMFSLALKSDGTVWAWGQNQFGEMGNGSGAVTQTAPVRVGSLANIVAIATNDQNTGYALAANGEVWGWGRNGADNTILGSARIGCSTACTPQVIAGLPSNVTQIFAANASVGSANTYALARTADGKVFGWGQDFYGELGLGRLDFTAVPYNFATPQLLRQGVVASDFDLDYSSDILLRNSATGEAWLWNLRDGAVAESAGIGTVNTSWQIVGLGDADGDGKDDIFWRNATTGANSVWFMDNRNFKGTIPLDTVADLGWTVAAIADFNDDGRADMLWRNDAAGLWAVWLLGSSGVLESRAYGGVPSGWQVAGAADFSGDSKADIIWTRPSDGALAIYRMNGLDVAGVSFIASGLGEWTVADIADLDRDGRAEILLRYNTGAATARLKLDSDGSALRAGVQSCTTSNPSTYGVLFCPAAGNEWQVATVGDFDADTHADILWRNAAGELVLWRLVDLMLPGTTENERLQNVKWLGNPGTVWQVIGR